MFRRTIALIVGALLMQFAVQFAAAPSPAAAIEPPATTTQPNIVVFYLDDVNPVDGRLWDNPDLTPNLYDMFVQDGVDFPHAIGETPLCCPSRATLITGLHTHNTGVTINDVALFNPQEQIGKAVQSVGYESMLIGKYMNHPEHLDDAGWQLHSAGWDVFDVFMNEGTAAYFYDYALYTKDQGILYPPEHSTQMIAERTVARMAATDPGKPIFAILSLADTHRPNTPIPMFADDTRCDSMPPWDPPNYNEADVSDKPTYVQKTGLLPYPDGWPMVAYCREMLGVDWLVGQVRDELAAEGRLDNTVFVFTADNGMGWGQHRLELKDTPYSTPLPLYFAWPSHWAPRTIETYTSDIDLAPTFCDLAGCTLTGFPGGQTRPDGVSLVPVLDGDVADLSRDALLETEYRVHPFAGLRTTNLSPLGLWHYVEYQDGFKELYNVDPAADPWELQNLAGDPAYAGLEAQLHDRLVQLLAEGRPALPATITIVEDSRPNSQQDFQYTGDLGDFSLDDDSDATLPRKQVFSDLAPGSYTVTQSPVLGWALSSLVCPPGNEVDQGAGRVTIEALPDSSIVCTFTNQPIHPDASIALSADGPYKGDNIYHKRPIKKQTQRRDEVASGFDYDFVVALQNDSHVDDSFVISSAESGAGSIGLRYLVDGVDVTAQVRSGTYVADELAPGAQIYMTVRFSVPLDAPTGIKRKAVVRQTSVLAPGRTDSVRAIVTH